MKKDAATFKRLSEDNSKAGRRRQEAEGKKAIRDYNNSRPKP